MTIHLPANLESSILEVVQSGQFASVDDAMAEAARLLLQQVKREQQIKTPVARQESPAPAHKPIWEVFEEITASIPEEEWAKLPTDGAEQHDHYIYGTPKRLPAP
jgi:Arc/MetJ-type ribon-helix-helix transcriptional regulator